MPTRACVPASSRFVLLCATSCCYSLQGIPHGDPAVDGAGDGASDPGTGRRRVVHFPGACEAARPRGPGHTQTGSSVLHDQSVPAGHRLVRIRDRPSRVHTGTGAVWLSSTENANDSHIPSSHNSHTPSLALSLSFFSSSYGAIMSSSSL